MDLRYRLRPMDPRAADELRAIGGPISVVDEHPGFPCRQCRRDAEVGDEVILVSHDPFTATSPYRSASPVFLHRHDCGTPAEVDETTDLPDQLTRRQLSVRAFDASAMMLDAAHITGADLRPTIERLLADPDVVELHVHNSPRGCWAATVERR